MPLTYRQGTVTRASPQRFALRCETVAGCALCAAGQGCRGNLLGRWLRSGREPELELEQPDPPVAIGDAVIIAVPSGTIWRAAATVYLLPLASMLLIALLAALPGAGRGDGPALAGAVLGLALGVWLARRSAQRLLQRPDVRPVFVRRA